MSNKSNKASREVFLRSISSNPLLAIEEAKMSFSTLKQTAGSPLIALGHATKILSLFCSYFPRWEKEGRHAPEFEQSKDKFLLHCLFGIERLFNAFDLGERSFSIVSSVWSSITAWTIHVYAEVYPFAALEEQRDWRQCLVRVCNIAERTDASISNIFVSDSSCRMIVDLWTKVDDNRIAHALWTCCKTKVYDRTSHPTQYLTEFGLTPDGAVDLALDRLSTSYKVYLGTSRTVWRSVVSNIYALTTLSNSPEAAFRAAMFKKNVFSFVTHLIRRIRRRDLSASNCAFRIHALTAFCEGLVGMMFREGGVRCLAQALRKGLAEVIVLAITSARHVTLGEAETRCVEYLEQTLFNVFPVLFAEKSIVAAAGRSMDKFKYAAANDIVATAGTPSELKLEREWRGFTQLLLERFILLRVKAYILQAEEHVCSNPLCNLVRSNKYMRKCARCHRALYCSKACQRSHWREYNHKVVCEKKGEKKPWDKHYLQMVALNAVFCHLTALHQGKRSEVIFQGVAPHHAGFIVSLVDKITEVDVVDLRDKTQWTAGYERLYESALVEAEKRALGRVPTQGNHTSNANTSVDICIKVRYPPYGSATVREFVFVARCRMPGAENELADLPAVKLRNWDCRSDLPLVVPASSAYVPRGEVLGQPARQHGNLLHRIVASVREAMREGTNLSRQAEQPDLGFWTEAVVDRCIRSVDESMEGGSLRDALGYAIANYPL